MVMLIVNILQLLITVLFFILPAPILTQAQLSVSTSDPASNHLDDHHQQQHYGALIVPAILQSIVFIATCTLLKIVRAESRHSDRGHSRHRLSSATTNAAATVPLNTPAPASSSPSSSSSSTSSSSGTDCSDQDDDNEESNENKTEAIALKKRSSKDLEAAPRKFRRPSKNKNHHLLLPYILWACQLVQLASGLWPLQSFISYSTLLLYSYTVYVIFPIRLMSCVLLALGLSLSQPAIDYLLLLNFQSTNMTPMTSHFSKVSTQFYGQFYIANILCDPDRDTRQRKFANHPNFSAQSLKTSSRLYVCCSSL